MAIAASGTMIGYQSLDLYSPVLPSMAHVGQLGTFLLPEWRGRGVGQALFNATSRSLCRSAIETGHPGQGSNLSAQAFYKRLGFVECGRLRGQVIIDGWDDDELVMEFFLTR